MTVTSLVNWGNALDIVYLDSAKLLTASHGILINKIAKYGIDNSILRGVHSWLNDYTQRVVVRDVKLTGEAY